MRKHRYYLGKRHINHDLLRQGHVGVAPRLLRAHYLLTYKLRQQATTLKIAMNASYGARASIPVRTAEEHRALLDARQAAALGGAGRLSYKDASATYDTIRQLLTNKAA